MWKNNEYMTDKRMGGVENNNWDRCG